MKKCVKLRVLCDTCLIDDVVRPLKKGQELIVTEYYGDWGTIDGVEYMLQEDEFELIEVIED